MSRRLVEKRTNRTACFDSMKGRHSCAELPGRRKMRVPRTNGHTSCLAISVASRQIDSPRPRFRAHHPLPARRARYSPPLRPCTIAADGSPITLNGEPTLRASPIAHVVAGKLDVRAASKRTGMETPHQSGIL